MKGAVSMFPSRRNVHQVLWCRRPARHLANINAVKQIYLSKDQQTMTYISYGAEFQLMSQDTLESVPGQT
jgi:hypothetical protein